MVDLEVQELKNLEIRRDIDENKYIKNLRSYRDLFFLKSVKTSKSLGKSSWLGF